MTRSCLPALFASALLLGCSTAPKVDPLEAKAKDGDPVAACQLAARSLQDCALALQSWETSKIGPRPACVSEGIGDRQMSYLDQAGDKLGSTNQVLFLVGPRIQLLTAAVAVLTGPSDKAIQAAADALQSCAKFENDMAG